MTDATPPASELGWVDDIEAATLGNEDFRRVLYTGAHLQLTVMSLGAGENIGWEMHDHLDQFLRIERGTGTLKLGTVGRRRRRAAPGVRRLGDDHPGRHVARRRQRRRRRAQAVLRVRTT